MPDLSSVRLKLERAREHQKAVNDDVRRSLETPPYSVRPEIDSESGEQRWRVHGEPRIPDDNIALLAGDCLYDFRCALDHLVWQLGDMSGMQRPDRTMFPLFDDPDRFLRIGFPRIRELKSEMLARITMSQPCYGWNRYFNTALCTLESLGNIDKHRHLNVLAASLGGALWAPSSPISGGRSFVDGGPVCDGTVIAIFPSDEVKVEFRILFTVAFGESQPMVGGGDVMVACP